MIRSVLKTALPSLTKPKEKELTIMINIRTIRKLTNNGGLTLKNGKIITYKSGWQVADHGIEARSAEEAIKAVKAMGGNCGIWLEDGIYYIDHSFRVNTKREAMEIGRAHNQISVLCWRTMGLAYC
jgi:predicted ATP-grasp superfamily ATP-dependent carboligase